jgi:hypothetical protein
MTLCDETLEDRIQRKGLAAPAARARRRTRRSILLCPAVLIVIENRDVAVAGVATGV